MVAVSGVQYAVISEWIQNGGVAIENTIAGLDICTNGPDPITGIKVYETMVFDENGAAVDEYTARCYDRELAVYQHMDVVQKVADKYSPPSVHSRIYPDSDIAPDWFDESAAGERWNDDY